MKPRNQSLSPTRLAVAATLALAGNLTAGSITWDGDTSTDWTNGANWAGGTAPANTISTDTAVFNAATTNQPSINASRSVGGIDFGNATGGWTLGGTGTLTLGDKGIDATSFANGTNTVSVANIIMGSVTSSTWTLSVSANTNLDPTTTNISSNIQLHETAQLQLNSARGGSGGVGTMNVSGVISNTTGKATSGQMKYLGGSGSKNFFNVTGLNTYTGNTLISQAVVTVNTLADTGTASALGSSGSINVTENTSFSTLAFSGTSPASTNRRVTIGGTFAGAAGQANIDNNSATANTLAFTSTESVIAGGSGNRILGLRGTNTGNNSFAQLIENATSGATTLRKEGAGKWIIANNSNTYTGETVLVGGTLEVSALADSGSASALGSNGTIRFNGGSLTYTGGATSSNRSLAIGPTTGTGVVNATLRSSGGGALTLNASAMTYGTIDQGRTLTLGGTNTGANTFATPLANNGTAQTGLTKADSGKWILTNTHTYTGATTVSAGTLLVDGALGNTAVSVSNAATIGGAGTIAGSLTFVGNSFLDVESAVFDSDPLGVNGTVTFAAGFGIDNLKISNWDSVPVGTYTILSSTQDFSIAGLDNWGASSAAAVGTPALGRTAYFKNGSLQIVVVPEPATALLGGLGMLGLLRRRRRVG